MHHQDVPLVPPTAVSISSHPCRPHVKALSVSPGPETSPTPSPHHFLRVQRGGSGTEGRFFVWDWKEGGVGWRSRRRHGRYRGAPGWRTGDPGTVGAEGSTGLTTMRGPSVPLCEGDGAVGGKGSVPFRDCYRESVGHRTCVMGTKPNDGRGPPDDPKDRTHRIYIETEGRP